MTKPILILDTFHKSTIHGWHELIDPDESTRLATLFGTNDEVEKAANKLYGKHYEIITRQLNVDPISDFGGHMRVGDRYRKKRSHKSKSKRKCRCKK